MTVARVPFWASSSPEAPTTISPCHLAGCLVRQRGGHGSSIYRNKFSKKKKRIHLQRLWMGRDSKVLGARTPSMARVRSPPRSGLHPRVQNRQLSSWGIVSCWIQWDTITTMSTQNQTRRQFGLGRAHGHGSSLGLGRISYRSVPLRPLALRVSPTPSTVAFHGSSVLA